MDNIPAWIALTGSVGVSLLVALLTQLVVVPLQRRTIAKKLRAHNPVKFNFEDSVGKSSSSRLYRLYQLLKSATNSPQSHRLRVALRSSAVPCRWLARENLCRQLLKSPSWSHSATIRQRHSSWRHLDSLQRITMLPLTITRSIQSSYARQKIYWAKRVWITRT